MAENRPTAGPASNRRIATLLALFGTVFFLRLWLVREWGSPIPFWDQWDSEARNLFRPWLNGTLDWRYLFSPVNEHRILLTRLLDLALLTIAGSWETWWQLIANAALNAAAPVILAAYFWRHLPGRSRSAFCIVTVLLFTTPSSWQNALWGIQSICFFVNALTCLAVVHLLGAKPFGPRWWFGWLAALLVLFAQGSGVFAAMAVAAVLALGLALAAPRDRKTCWTLAAVAIVIGLGILLRVEVPKHAYLQTRSIGEFFAVFLRCLAWPHVTQPLAAGLLNAPLLWLLQELVRHRRRPSSGEAVALALGVVSLLNAAAVGYSRGAGLVDHVPISRYHDSFAPGVAANLLILLGSISRLRSGKIFTWGWIGLLLLGLGTAATTSLTLHLPFKAEQNRIAAAMIAAYRETHDPAVFVTEPPFLRPHPDPHSVIDVLEDPTLAPILPPELRGTAAPKPWLIEQAPWLAFAATTLLVGLLVTARRNAKPRPATPAP
jgi:hypothetical protein